MLELAWNRLDGIGRDDLLGFQRVFYPAGYAFALHRHDFHELIYVVSGSGFHDAAQGGLPLRAGQLLAIRPELAHRCRAGGEALVFLNLVVRPRLAAEMAETLAAVPGWDQPGPPPALRPGGGDATALLDHLAELERGEARRDRLAAVALLTDLAWRCRRRAAGDPGARAGPLGRLQAALDDPQALAGGATAIAAAVGCTREHLTRLARRQLGRSLADLVAERRLDHAARLLRQGDASATAVCHASGHGNLGHFYSRFRRRYGCTPQEFRQRGPDRPA